MRAHTMFAGILALSALPVLAETGITLTDPNALAWETTPEGVAFAALDGVRFESAYLAMVRLPAGTVSPPHIKSANMFGVMIEGHMTHSAVGAEISEPIGPGGYYKIPAGFAHVSACVSATPCVTFLYQDGAFDFLPVPQ